MNKSNAAQFLPLVQALADGKVIQLAHNDTGWTDITDPNFWYDPVHWRIKPEPREWEIQYLGMNQYRVFGPEMESSKIRVREILD